MKSFAYLLLCMGLFLTVGCNKDDDSSENENITTVEIHLTGPGLDKRFVWNDPDGDGGASPTIDRITLPPLTGNISCFVHFYDRSKNPVQDLTTEIEAEKDAHLILLTVTGPKVTITPQDRDSKGLPFGLLTKWQTDQPATGTLRVRLIHEPTDKNSTTNPGGEVDADVQFPIDIK